MGTLEGRCGDGFFAAGPGGIVLGSGRCDGLEGGTTVGVAGALTAGGGTLEGAGRGTKPETRGASSLRAPMRTSPDARGTLFPSPAWRETFGSSPEILGVGGGRDGRGESGRGGPFLPACILKITNCKGRSLTRGKRFVESARRSWAHSARRRTAWICEDGSPSILRRCMLLSL